MDGLRRRVTGGVAGLCALAATLGLVGSTGAPAATSPAAVAQAAMRSDPMAGPVSPQLPCAALAQPEPGQGVPDFGSIPGAPTRVSSATVVPATASTPEFCDVKGYVATQVQFELKLPTKTWQGRYLQNGGGRLCGAVRPPTLPSRDLPTARGFSGS